MNIHQNAKLTPLDREQLVQRMLSGQSPEAAARGVGICPRSDRAKGGRPLLTRCSAGKRGPWATRRCEPGGPPKQRLTEGEKAQIKDGKVADEIWGNPKRAAQKGTNARWTIKYSRKKDDAPRGQVDIAIPSYGYKSHICTDRARINIGLCNIAYNMRRLIMHERTAGMA